MPREKDVIELLAKIVREYIYSCNVSASVFLATDQLFFLHLREFLSLNPKDQFGNTLLHEYTYSCNVSA